MSQLKYKEALKEWKEELTSQISISYLPYYDEHMDEAFAAIRLDSQAPGDVLDLLMEIPEIISVQQLHC